MLDPWFIADDSNPRILVVGSANMDLVFGTERFPDPGETLTALDFSTVPGGKGANQAVAIGRMGGSVSFVGCVGLDAFGDQLVTSLKQAGVDLTFLKRSETPTGCASITVNCMGQNEIIVAPGANAEVCGEDVSYALEAWPYAYVLAQMEIPEAAVKAAGSTRTLILNPAPVRPISDGLYARCLAITPNETECELLTGIRPVDSKSCRAAARYFHKREVRNVVITLGERGCYYNGVDGEIVLPAHPVEVVDTVGAGDAFNGALAWFYAKTYDWKEALSIANSAAALAVTRAGAQNSMPPLRELGSFRNPARG
jgi:ribokinase